MSTLIRVWPVEGRLVRHPETGAALPKEGLEVRRSPFWLRRIRTGDVTTAPPVVAESQPTDDAAQEPAPAAALELSADEEEAIASVAVEAPTADPEADAAESDKPSKGKSRRKDGRFAS